MSRIVTPTYPRFRHNPEQYIPSVDNLSSTITINSLDGTNVLRYKGGDATLVSWPAWGVGQTLPIAGSGSDVSPNYGSPLFSSNDDSVKLPGAKGYQPTTDTDYANITTEDLYMGCLFRTPSTLAIEFIFSKYTGISGYAFYLTFTNLLRILVKSSAGYYYFDYNTAVVPNTWYFIQFFWDRSETTEANAAKLYVNGLENTAYTKSGVADPSEVANISSIDKFTIGAKDNGWAAQSFTGALALIHMAKRTNWFAGGAQNLTDWAAFHASEYARLTGTQPQIYKGTALPTFTRAGPAISSKTQYPNNALSLPNPHMWLKFDESSGSAISDSSGNGRNQTLIGSAAAFWVTGKYSNCGYFNSAVPNYVSLSISYFDGTKGTWACWIKADWSSLLVSESRLVCTEHTVNNNYKHRTYVTTATLAWQIGNGSATTTCNTGSLAAYNNQWVHIAYTWNYPGSGNTTIKSYVNGVNINTSTLAGPLSNPDSKFYLAQWDTVAGNFTGYVDDFGLWQTTLTPDQIYYLYNSTIDYDSYPYRKNYQVGVGWTRTSKVLDANGIEFIGGYTEPSAENKCLQSEARGTTWTKVNAGDTVSSDQMAGLDGEVTADAIIADATDTQHGYAQAITLTAATWCYSDHLKIGTKNWGCLLNNTVANCYAYFDLVNGVVGSKGAGCTGHLMIPLGNGWYRCYIYFTGTAAAHSLRSLAAHADNDNDFAGNGTDKSLYFWGAQCELGSYPTSYIQTTTAAVTRQADVLYWKGDDGNIGGVGSDKKGSISFSILPVGSLPASNINVAQLNDGGAAADRALVYINTSGYVVLELAATGGTTRTITGPAVSVCDRAIHRVRVSYQIGRAIVMVDGVAGTPNTSVVAADIPDDLDRIRPTDGIIGNFRVNNRPVWSANMYV